MSWDISSHQFCVVSSNWKPGPWQVKQRSAWSSGPCWGLLEVWTGQVWSGLFPYMSADGSQPLSKLPSACCSPCCGPLSVPSSGALISPTSPLLSRPDSIHRSPDHLPRHHCLPWSCTRCCLRLHQRYWLSLCVLTVRVHVCWIILELCSKCHVQIDYLFHLTPRKYQVFFFFLYVWILEAFNNHY